MASTSSWRALCVIVVGFAGALPGCVAAAAAAAGAGTGVYLTSRGAESIVEGSIDNVEKRARAVFAAEGIPVTGSQVENSGAKREIKGTRATWRSPSPWSSRARRPPRRRFPHGRTSPSETRTTRSSCSARSSPRSEIHLIRWGGPTTS